MEVEQDTHKRQVDHRSKVLSLSHVCVCVCARAQAWGRRRRTQRRRSRPHLLELEPLDVLADVLPDEDSVLGELLAQRLHGLLEGYSVGFKRALGEPRERLQVARHLPAVRESSACARVCVCVYVHVYVFECMSGGGRPGQPERLSKGSLAQFPGRRSRCYLVPLAVPLSLV
jgi:hypothetical protein